MPQVSAASTVVLPLAAAMTARHSQEQAMHLTNNIRRTRPGALVAATTLFAAALAFGTAYAASSSTHHATNRTSAWQGSHAPAPAQARLGLQPSSASWRRASLKPSP